MNQTPNIAEAVALLDRHRPGWHNEIDLEQLRMDNARQCILGQLYGHYVEGKRILGVPRYLVNAFCNFDDEWKQLIIERRRADNPVAAAAYDLFQGKYFNDMYAPQGNQTMPNSTGIFRRNAESALGISQQAIPAGFDDIIHRLGKSIATNRTDADTDHIMSLCKTFKNMSDKSFKVAAIKLVRTFTNCGLREAKDFVEYCQEML